MWQKYYDDNTRPSGKIRELTWQEWVTKHPKAAIDLIGVLRHEIWLGQDDIEVLGHYECLIIDEIEPVINDLTVKEENGSHH